MRAERYWVAVVPEETYERERLYAHERLVLAVDVLTVQDQPDVGEVVALVADVDPPVLFGLGRVRVSGGVSVGRDLAIAYTHRLFDEPLPVDIPAPAPGVTGLTEAEYERLAGRVDANKRVDADKSVWFVSVALPIEAASAAEAVREFWTYTEKLGPRELPAYVWPPNDELAMQTFVLGAESNEDPEEAD